MNPGIVVVAVPYGPTAAATNAALRADPTVAALLRDGWRVASVWTEATPSGANVVVALAREGDPVAPAASDARSTAILASFAAIVAVATTLLTLAVWL